MQLSHTGDYGFLALGVKMYPESRVLSGEAVDAFGEFVRVVLKEPEDIAVMCYTFYFYVGVSGIYLNASLTLLTGFIAIEMTGSGTWIDSCSTHKIK